MVIHFWEYLRIYGPTFYKQLQAQQLINICKEYVLGLTMEIYRKEQPKGNLDDQKRNCEVSGTLYSALGVSWPNGQEHCTQPLGPIS